MQLVQTKQHTERRKTKLESELETILERAHEQGFRLDPSAPFELDQQGVYLEGLSCCIEAADICTVLYCVTPVYIMRAVTGLGVATSKLLMHAFLDCGSNGVACFRGPQARPGRKVC